MIRPYVASINIFPLGNLKQLCQMDQTEKFILIYFDTVDHVT